jgi:hypothetical protein
MSTVLISAQLDKMVPAIIATASGIVGGENPLYGREDFFSYFPQFRGPDALELPVDQIFANDVDRDAFFSANPNRLIPGNSDYYPYCQTGEMKQRREGGEWVNFISPAIPGFLIDSYIKIANAIVKERMWGELWRWAMSLVIAHFLTLYLRSSNPETFGKEGQSVANAIAGTYPMGWTASKSVNDVSVSYDYSFINDTLKKWGSWTLTDFGIQYITQAKLAGKVGMYVW